MNFRHILFILVYFIATILASSSISATSEESSDLEKNESQIEIPPVVSTDNTPSISERDAVIKDETFNTNLLIKESKITVDKINEERNEKHEKYEEEVVVVVEKNESISESETVQENLTIPVFSEWTQQMQEAEKKLVELTGNSTQSNKDIKNETLAKPQIVKMRQKNYASPDCGAKILGSNPEAQSPSSVLSDKDEYMLSPCTDRIWFILELCDSIQAKRVELANFELFSSPLKSVSISISNRFPTREWTIAGHFDARDIRDIQVFDLKDVTLFGKFVRVDLQYSITEHYCPLSFFRIFGTSEIEAFETENELENVDHHIGGEDDDYMHSQKKLENNNKDNILNRAGAAVMSIVQKAAEVLVKSNGNDAKLNVSSSKQFQDSCMSLSHNILCEICSSDERVNLNNFIGCKNIALLNLLETNHDIRRYLTNSITCNNILGFNLKSNDIETNRNFIVSILPNKYIAAMCNIVARDQKALSIRIEDISDISSNLVSKKDEVSLKNVSKKVANDDDSQCKHTTTELTPTEIPSDLQKDNVTMKSVGENVQGDSKNKSANIDEHNIFNDIDVHKRKVDEVLNESTKLESQNKIETLQNEQPVEAKDPVKITEESKLETHKTDSQPSSKPSSELKNQSQQRVIEPDVKPLPPIEMKQDQIAEIKVVNGEFRASPNAPESVFLRLSNRIKVLEKNMTLSTQYLEELSRRYKKQIEDLQQAYSKLQILYDNLNHSGKENEKRTDDEKRQFRESIDELNKKSYYMEIILLILGAFALLQTIWIVILFKRMSVLSESFGNNSNAQTDLEEKATSDNVQANDKTARKKNKQRIRKISAPNILTQRSMNAKNEFSPPVSILNRTVSAPYKVNDMVELKENLSIMEQSTMLEENDGVLLLRFDDLKINDENDTPKKSKIQNTDEDTTSTASAKTDDNSNKSFNFRRLSSPTFLKLKKTTSMKIKNGRSNDTWKKAKSESPPKNHFEHTSVHKSNSFHIQEEDSLKFRKNNSFKKLFKKLF